MGRLLILLVLAAGISSVFLASSTRRTVAEAAGAHADGQADVIVREIAEAGQAVALTQMVGPDGFVDPTIVLGDGQPYDGGAYQIDYTPGATTTEGTVRVTGTYGGAVHTIESTYAYDPLDAPGPIWLDVPHVVATVVGSPDIKGGPRNLPVQLDRRKSDAQGLGALLPIGDLVNTLGTALAGTGSAVAAPEASAWVGEGNLLGDLNVATADELFQRAVGAMDASDVTLVGDQVVSGTVQWGASSDGTQVTHVDGDLTVTGKVRGHGALLVDGALRVPKGGELEWEGIIVVRSDEAVLPIELLGKVKLKGMMAVAHEATLGGGPLGGVTSAVLSLLRDQLLGGSFGTQLSLGKDVDIRFDLDQIAELADKLEFDGTEIHLVSTRSSHLTAAEGKMEAEEEPSCTDPAAIVNICNKPDTKKGLNWRDRTDTCSRWETDHSVHGCLLGTCAANDIDPNASSADLVTVCRPDGGDPAASWNEVEMSYLDLTAFLLANPLGDVGTCSATGH